MVRLVQLLGLPLPRRRRHGAALDGRPVALRRTDGGYRRLDPLRAPERHARLAQQDHRAAGLGARRLREVAVGPSAAGRPLRPRRRDEQHRAADVAGAAEGGPREHVAAVGGAELMRRGVLLPFVLALGGCGGIQTVGGREGRDAAIINDLFTVFCIVTAVFFVAVMAFLFAAYWRRRGHREDGLPDELAAPSRGPLLRM